MEQQICQTCKISKDLNKDNFWQGQWKVKSGEKKFYWHKSCKVCERPQILINIQKYKNKNRKILAEKQKEYYASNKENDAKTKKIWYENNKENVKVSVKNWLRNKRKNNPVFKIKESISTQIRLIIKKDNLPFLKFLPYNLEELKQHLEYQFESWMTWDNCGVYRIDDWDDNDQSTWKWQLDHIIPHSTFNYTSMEDEDFKKCWDLSNLRPLSAKQNILDGNRR
jgi:hypothetical protein